MQMSQAMSHLTLHLGEDRLPGLQGLPRALDVPGALRPRLHVVEVTSLELLWKVESRDGVGCIVLIASVGSGNWIAR